MHLATANQNIEYKNNVRNVSIKETELYAVSTRDSFIFVYSGKSTIGQFIPLTDSPWKVSDLQIFTLKSKFTNWIQPCLTCYFCCLLKDVLMFLKEVVCGDSHSGPHSVGLLKSPLSCLLWLPWRESPAKCHLMTEAVTCTIGNPVVVACLPHLTAAGTTASLKCRWSKACLAFGIKLYWKRQENRPTVMQEENMSPHRALHSKSDPAAAH